MLRAIVASFLKLILYISKSVIHYLNSVFFSAKILSEKAKSNIYATVANMLLFGKMKVSYKARKIPVFI